MRSRRAALLVAACLATACFTTAAQAQVVYKWTDANGKVQYSDQPPKGFKGVVTRIEPDFPAMPAGQGPAPPPRVTPALPDGVKAPDLGLERRERREKLQARLDEARAKVEAARKALETGSEATEDDRQVIQQRVANRVNGGSPIAASNADPTQGQVMGGGMMGMTPRNTCRAVTGADGRPVTVCSTALLKGDYSDRVASLEAALAKAEEELSVAEVAYRRGVD